MEVHDWLAQHSKTRHLIYKDASIEEFESNGNLYGYCYYNDLEVLGLAFFCYKEENLDLLKAAVPLGLESLAVEIVGCSIVRETEISFVYGIRQ